MCKEHQMSLRLGIRAIIKEVRRVACISWTERLKRTVSKVCKKGRNCWLNIKIVRQYSFGGLLTNESRRNTKCKDSVNKYILIGLGNLVCSVKCFHSKRLLAVFSGPKNACKPETSLDIKDPVKTSPFLSGISLHHVFCKEPYISHHEICQWNQLAVKIAHPFVERPSEKSERAVE